ncbi:phosphodiester glycosidase family protein [Candidatus Pacearchaeota archaeon]|nr:phosphodiester glycosidase family protein [Candidatus Pacearchaeota archaeon]
MGINRRDFIKKSLLMGAGAILGSKKGFAKETLQVSSKEFWHLPSPDYSNVNHEEIKWKNISKGLEFSRTKVFRENELVDVIATLKINPELNKIKVFNGYDESSGKVAGGTIEAWRNATGAIAMINSAQYMANPYYRPCALVICDRKQKGPKQNKSVRGMLVAEPKKSLVGKIKRADLLDFKYDKFDYKTPQYLEGVQHWPILLNREGKIKVKESLWQANRTVVAKTNEDEILFMTTEGGYFTLHNFGRFLRDSNQERGKGFNVNTAMNMDGGYEANMVIKSPNLSYVTYGEFETYGLGKDATVFGRKIEIPGVIGVFPR